MKPLNQAQRIIMVVGFGISLYFLGAWITTWGGSYGWVAYAPLTSTVSHGPFLFFHPWAQFLIWLGLIVLWSLCALVILRSPKQLPDDQPH
jgi:hypothetical protein